MAVALRHVGFQAIHVSDVGLLSASDKDIWTEAKRRSAILVTKDRDFAQLRATRAAGPIILWVRIGNKDNRSLISQILKTLPLIVSAVERGESVIEIVGR
jgi:predicted nuclease of predicted toxin-antitoxin system